MRKMIAFLSVMTLLVAGTPAYAINCGASTGGGTCCGGSSWYEYSPETLGEGNITYQCWTIDSGMNPISNSAWWNIPAFEVRGFSKYAARTAFTVPSDGYSGKWEADLMVDFNDPHSSWWNQITATATVYHNGTGTSYTIYYHNGTQGNDRGHGAYVLFNAAAGDTIYISIQGTWSGDSDTHVQFFDARLFHYSF